ncbi:MAG: DUF4294 domain-containing protein [Chitinophagaceae bacterium]|nr:DUF4294 domain-containing protein [Chitinophagaceae bacterium]
MLSRIRPILNKRHAILLGILIACTGGRVFAQTGTLDTLTTYAIVYEGDTIEAKTLADYEMLARYADGKQSNRAKWARLRRAIIITYPYAQRSGVILNEMNARLAGMSDKSERRKYIKSREKELKKDFTDPLSNLSTYQGRVLMKLINRETGNNCYEIIKEYKGGLTARFYQTVAFFFNNNLKQNYDAAGEDRDIEIILKEVCQTYGFYYSYNRRM